MEYLVHDKEAATSERVAWTHTENLITKDPEKAARVMAWTDMHSDDLKRSSGGSLAGEKTSRGSVYHYSLSWAHDESPSVEHQRVYAQHTVKALGFEDHQYVLVAHDDTDHAHVHVVVNLTHPETGKRGSIYQDQRKIQAWALAYEKKHGIKCEQRVHNAQEYENGQATKYEYRDEKKDYTLEVTRAFALSDNGKSFVAALEMEGLRIAENKNKNGFVLIDERGVFHALTRNLAPVDKYHTPIKGKGKTKLINDRMQDIKDRSTLGDANKIANQRKAHFERQEAEKKAEYERQNTVLDKELEEQKRQKDIDKGEILHALELEREDKAKEYYDREEGRILGKAKKDFHDLKHARKELGALAIEYRATDTKEEAAHRKQWETVIRSEEKEKARLEEIRPSWFYSFVYKVRHGQSVDEGIKAQEKNILNAKMRLEEGVGSLTRGEKFELMTKGKALNKQHEEINARVAKELQEAQENARIRAQKEHETAVLELEERSELKQHSHNETVKDRLSKEAKENLEAAKEKRLEYAQEDIRPIDEKWKTVLAKETPAQPDTWEDIQAKLEGREKEIVHSKTLSEEQQIEAFRELESERDRLRREFTAQRGEEFTQEKDKGLEYD